MYFLFTASFFIWGIQTEAGSRLLLDFPDYCLGEFRCGTMMHLLCMNHMRRDSKLCSKVLFETDQKLRQDLFHRVNSFRQILAGGGLPLFPEGASNMRQVSWDYELEKMAEAWTFMYIDQLQVEKDFTKPCTKTAEFKDGASILAYVLGPDELASDAVAIWTKQALPPEIAWDFRPVTANGSTYDEYATIVWAETFKMGCSVASCNPHGYLGRRPMNQITVVACLFGPKGNSRGQRVFRNGTACSECPARTSCNPNSEWHKLCARRDDFDVIYGPDGPQFPIAKLIAFLLPLTSVVVLMTMILLKNR